MKIHEYQGKQILREFGVPVPRGIPAFTVDEAVKAAEEPEHKRAFGDPWRGLKDGHYYFGGDDAASVAKLMRK